MLKFLPSIRKARVASNKPLEQCHVINAADAHVLAFEALWREDQLGVPPSPSASLSSDESWESRVRGTAFFIGDNPLESEPISQRHERLLKALGFEPPWLSVYPFILNMVGGLFEFGAYLLHSEKPLPLTRYEVLAASTMTIHSSERARKLLGYSPRISISTGEDAMFDYYKKLQKDGEF